MLAPQLREACPGKQPLLSNVVFVLAVHANDVVEISVIDAAVL